MQSHVIMLDTTCTTYTFYEIEKRKELIKKNQKQRRQIETDIYIHIYIYQVYIRNKLSPPPAGDVETLEKNELEEKTRRKTSLLVNRVRNKGKKQANQSTHTLQVAGAGCDTGSIARFSLLVRFVPCYPGCRLGPAFVSYAQRLDSRLN